jgi:hypothetical protein
MTLWEIVKFCFAGACFFAAAVWAPMLFMIYVCTLPIWIGPYLLIRKIRRAHA